MFTCKPSILYRQPTTFDIQTEQLLFHVDAKFSCFPVQKWLNKKHLKVTFEKKFVN